MKQEPNSRRALSGRQGGNLSPAREDVKAAPDAPPRAAPSWAHTDKEAA